MNTPHDPHDTYVIPPNFIEGTTLFGGMFPTRHVIEAGVIAALVGLPLLAVPLSLTARIILLCLTALPLALLALIGVSGQPFSVFLLQFWRFLRNRRILKQTETAATPDPVAAFIPIEKIENGIIYTRDHRYVKLLEVRPVNFLLRSAQEQRNIIYAFISYLKISPVRIQFKVLTKRADMQKHMAIVQ